MYSLGQFLRSRRRELGLTQVTTAKKIGMSQSLYCKYEHDEIKIPGDEMLDRFSQALEVEFRTLKRKRPKKMLKRPVSKLAKLISSGIKKNNLKPSTVPHGLRLSNIRRIQSRTARFLSERLNIKLSKFSEFTDFTRKSTDNRIGQIVRAGRLEKCMSQQELAHKMGRGTRAWVSAIETGQIRFSASEPLLTRLAMAFGWTPSVLLKLKPERNRKFQVVARR